MSWEDELFALYDDLEGQTGVLAAADTDAEDADRGRIDYRSVTLASRLMASVGGELTLQVAGVGAVTGVVDRVAADWLLISSGDDDWLVSADAVTTVQQASVRSIPEATWSPVMRLGLGPALRRIAEAGERCLLHLRDGSRHEGNLRRIGSDFCELVEAEDRRMVLVPFTALAAAQSRA